MRCRIVFPLFLVFVFSQVPSSKGHLGHDHHHHDHDHGHGHMHAHDHGHGHDHHHHNHEHVEEPPSFKYSKQANAEPAQQKQQQQSQSAKPHTHSHGTVPSTHHSHSHAAATKTVPGTPANQVVREAWLYAVGSTVLISIAPFFILYFIPISTNDPEHQPLLRILLSFASGGLLGDAFLHLIPHAVPHSHGHDDHHHQHDHEEEPVHDHMVHTVVGMWVLGGIISFLVVEKIIRHLKIGHSHSHSHEHDHKHESNAERKTSEPSKAPLKKSSSSEGEKVAKEDDGFEVVRQRKLETGDKEVDVVEKRVSEEPSPSSKDVPHSHVGEIRVSGYLNLAADFVHNFTDGLAIGASYLAGKNIGHVTMFTVLLHEIPHEIGDFALLVQSGYPKYKAIRLQLVTALGALAGCFVSLYFGSTEVEGQTLWVLPFTAGGFIYIATVSVIPELLTETTVGQSIKEVIALLVGIAMMVFIAYIE